MVNIGDVEDRAGSQTEGQQPEQNTGSEEGQQPEQQTGSQAEHPPTQEQGEEGELCVEDEPRTFAEVHISRRLWLLALSFARV